MRLFSHAEGHSIFEYFVGRKLDVSSFREYQDTTGPFVIFRDIETGVK